MLWRSGKPARYVARRSAAVRMRAKTGVLLISSRGGAARSPSAPGNRPAQTLARAAEQHAIAAGERLLARMLMAGRHIYVPARPRQPAPRSAHAHRRRAVAARRAGARCRPAPSRSTSQVQLAALPASAESGINSTSTSGGILSQVAAARDVRAICEAAGLPRRALAAWPASAIGLVELLPPADAPPGGRLAAEPAYDLLAALLRRFRGPGEP